MLPSERILTLLMEHLQEELGCRVSAESGPRGYSIWVYYPGLRPIVANLMVVGESLTLNMAPLHEDAGPLSEEIWRDTYQIIKGTLPNVKRRNADDSMRELERQWQASGSEQDKAKFESAARRAGLCPVCRSNLVAQDCKACNLQPCPECDYRCVRCRAWGHEQCQVKCTHCGDSFCKTCVGKCPHCKNDFCLDGMETVIGGWDDEEDGCIDPGRGGHGCPEWAAQPED